MGCLCNRRHGAEILHVPMLPHYGLSLMARHEQLQSFGVQRQLLNISLALSNVVFTNPIHIVMAECLETTYSRLIELTALPIAYPALLYTFLGN